MFELRSSERKKVFCLKDPLLTQRKQNKRKKLGLLQQVSNMQRKGRLKFKTPAAVPTNSINQSVKKKKLMKKRKICWN